ncbi:MAG: protein kinase, partial [Chloroflexi bacterium]|nr:protein kinase [Chloroflexota bacterium]
MSIIQRGATEGHMSTQQTAGQASPGAEKIGVYTIVEPVAETPMTSVYRAIDSTDGRSVALRVSNAGLLADPGRLRGLIEAANQIAAVHHPNVLRVFEIGGEDGRFYVVTELLPQSLDINLEFSGQMSVAQAARLSSDIANGVAAAHDAGLVHAGLSPHNVLVGTDGVAKVSDFGAAALSRPAGRLPYFSPEQATGRPAEKASDIYALGALLYHMLAGRPPFDISDPRELLTAHAEAEPESIRTIRADLKVRFAKLVMSCLEKSPGRRPASMRELAEQLEEIAEKADGSVARKAVASGEDAPVVRRKTAAAGSSGPDGPPPAPSTAETPGTWTEAGEVSEPRAEGASVVLPSGNVLIFGGRGGVTTYEMYDPEMELWLPAAPAPDARIWPTATLLPDGNVLVAGGYTATEPLATALLFDPRKRTWSDTSAMSAARAEHSATLLEDGKVLVSGGLGTQGVLKSAELYDPGSGTWTSVDPMGCDRVRHTAIRLKDGKVLVAGGFAEAGNQASAELFDPRSATWNDTHAMEAPRWRHTATLLLNGEDPGAG